MVDPRAIVSPDARLHASVRVGAFSVIGAGVELGAGTVVGPHAVIEGPTTIGEDNRIYQFASVGTDPQDKKYAGEATRLVIGNGNTIRENCTLNRGTAHGNGETVIGDDNWIMAYVHIAHDCLIGNHTILANGTTLAGHVKVGDYAVLGGFSGAHQFCRIGAHAFLGMYAGVTRDVPAYTLVSSRPARPRGINQEGLKRRGFTPEQIRNIKDAYRILYRQGLTLAEALRRIEVRAAEQPELILLAQSVRDSVRGILR